MLDMKWIRTPQVIWDDLKKINPKLTLWIANPPYTDNWDEWNIIKRDFVGLTAFGFNLIDASP